MITSDLKELNIHELNPYEGDISLLLTENSQGLWKKLELDTATVVASANALAIVDNKIVSTPVGGGGGGNVELVGAVTGLGPLGTPVDTSLSPTIDIDTDIQTFDLNSSIPTTFNYEIQDGGVDTFSEEVTKGSSFVEVVSDFSDLPKKLIKTSDSGKFVWDQELQMGSSSFAIDYTSLSGDNLGNAFSIWTEDAGTYVNVYVSIYDASTKTWGPSSIINSTISSEGAAHCKIASNSSGEAIAIWMQTLGGTAIRASIYDPILETWSTPAVIVGPVSTTESPEVAMSDNGEGIAVWEINTNEMRGSVYNGSTWSTDVSISGVEFAINSFNLGIDNNGDAVVTYQAPVSYTIPDPRIIKSSTYDSGTQLWSTPVDVSNPADFCLQPHLSVDKSSGDAICTWTRDVLDGSMEIQYATYDGGTKTWSPLGVIKNFQPQATPDTQVALDPLGNAICIWNELEYTPSAEESLFGSNYNGSTWSAPILIYTPIAIKENTIKIGVDSLGNGVATWVKINQDQYIGSVSYNAVTQKWSSANRVSDNLIDDLSFDSQTNLVVSDVGAIFSWVDQDTSTDIVTSNFAIYEDTLFSVGSQKVDFSLNRVEEVGPPIEPSDVATKGYVDNRLNALLAEVYSLRSEIQELKEE